MPLSLIESQAVNDLAQALYSFLPGKAHPFANQSLSFQGVAIQVGLAQFWQGGSKLPAITLLLERTLSSNRGKFCPLILGIVRSGMVYRNSKSNPISRQEIESLNELISKVQFKIPELWDPAFLNSLPSQHQEPMLGSNKQELTQALEGLDADLLKISGMEPQPRGYAFEGFLQRFFTVSGLSPRSGFRLVGEQIDGSIQIGTDVYLVEAKWQDKQTALADLLVFREKVEAKAVWSRGLFVSHSGFTAECLEAFSKGRSTNIIGMTAQDIFFVLKGDISLFDAISQKARRAAETGEFYVSVFELTR